MSKTHGPWPRRKRVLVIEDDADTRHMLVTAIADEGYEPIPALDGHHALRTALAIEPSAIVLDLMLPELDGAEFVEAYRDAKGTTEPPIVVVSARHDAQAVADRIGARAVIPKPVNVVDLMTRLRAVMHGSRAHAAA